jgi:hypothetical protein
MTDENKLEGRLCVVLISSSTLQISGTFQAGTISSYNCQYIQFSAETLLCIKLQNHRTKWKTIGRFRDGIIIRSIGTRHCPLVVVFLTTNMSDYITTERGSNHDGGEIFRTRQGRPWGPPNLLYYGYRVFPGGKATGAWC